MFFTITINDHILQATLSNTEAAKELIKLLPLTIKMNDLNDNEKYGNLPLEIPTSDYYPNIISEGDIMLYGTKTLVIFYKTFPTTYQYTLLGKINKPSQLKKIMGSGPVTIKLSRPMSEK
ncbi:cyclophilin-like fold protein [Apibacter sp. HY039]|uniref:cyclophilin-like fold protein n=1 Tax=Apibacter sp. HY039 TaxID=2501476 RepID=UPI000FEBD015|nr:cyclophilin-like fold protein [Apibacter sp. HY039]